MARVIAGLAVAGAMSTSALAAPTTHTVVIETMRFEPANLTVAQGDRIVWVNRDIVPHTATAQNGGFDSGNLSSGQSWTFVAARSGQYSYVCRLHPSMRATITVR